jgi:hypothetical protein
LLPSEDDFDEAREIRKLAGRILSASNAIEEIIIDIISYTVFDEVKIRKDLVIGSILKSDWCTFSAKRKLFKMIVEEFNLLEGGSKNEIDKLLAEIIKYRNAFAHGSLNHNVDVHELRYFEIKPKTAILNDEYFVELERIFQEAWNKLQRIQENVKVVKK